MLEERFVRRTEHHNFWREKDDSFMCIEQKDDSFSFADFLTNRLNNLDPQDKDMISP